MTFDNVSGPWVLAGIGGLAAMLFALQQLRTRYQELTVVTTVFWKAAVDAAPVRTFRERFRHVWAYLLILGVCSLLWLAFSEPRIDAAETDRLHVLLLDGSAGMARDGRFEEAVDALKAYASRLPSTQRQVLWSGGELRTLLNPGEHALLLEKRLETLAPEATPATVERALRQLAVSARAERPTSVLVFGDAPVRKHVLDLLPPTVTVRRALATHPVEGNVGITALGVSEAASGVWDRVDVFVQVQSSLQRRDAMPAIEIDVDTERVSAAAIQRVARDGAEEILVKDLPARGGVFRARLSTRDTLALDDVARVRLPDKTPVRVLLSPSMAPALRVALDADLGVVVSRDTADVVIRRHGENVGATLPALEFISAAEQAPAFLLSHPDDRDSTTVFVEAVDAIGLKQIDAMGLAETAQRPIEVAITVGPQWKFSVWQEILSDRYNFIQSRSFPLFIASSVRWLAGTSAVYPYVAAGHPLVASSALSTDRVIDADGRQLDAPGVPFVPTRAGDLTLESGAGALAVSLLDAAVTTGEHESAIEVASAAELRVSTPTNLITWLLLTALVLLGVEWCFYQQGRIP